MYSFFFPKISGVFVMDSHAMKMLFDNVLGIVSLELFFSKMIGEKYVYFCLGMFGVFKEVVPNENGKWRPDGFLRSIQHSSDAMYDCVICYFLEHKFI
jgi:hypothetical protein